MTERARKVALFISLPILTAVFSIGGAVAGARAELGAKLDTTTFALYRERHQQRDTLIQLELQIELRGIRQDLQWLVCDRSPEQPRCGRDRAKAPLEDPVMRRRAGLSDYTDRSDK